VRVSRLHLASTHPDRSLPWADTDVDVYAYLIEHPDGLILVDTGVGSNELIETLYRPERQDIADAILGTGHDLNDVVVVINSHLHFDHCGNNQRFGRATILVQRREYEAAHEPYYTDPDWVDFPGADIRQLDGDYMVATGVQIVSTPGHTRGHQSVLVEDHDGRQVVVAQASYTAADFTTSEIGATNTLTEDEAIWRASLRRLHELRPGACYFSHDSTDWRPAD
jgi:glyoxylase-like metal-dependent hydrolase (beta-lactamase superfamily II)